MAKMVIIFARLQRCVTIRTPDSVSAGLIPLTAIYLILFLSIYKNMTIKTIYSKKLDSARVLAWSSQPKK